MGENESRMWRFGLRWNGMGWDFIIDLGLYDGLCVLLC